jgi:tetratricopeptide (TPR) repeat protein
MSSLNPFLALLLLLFLSSPAEAANRKELLSFADSLFEERDYYRAITEYKRFLHFFPEDGAAPGVVLRIAEGFLAGERWEEAEEALSRLARHYANSPEAESAALLHAGIPERHGNFAEAGSRYRRILEDPAVPGPIRRESRYRLAWTLIEQDRFDAARKELEMVEGPAAESLADEMGGLDRLPLKSPNLAGGLSALVPGTGQLYAGRPRDAALAFLLNAAFIWGALESFDDGNEVVGGILLFFEAGWYTGNIYNAVNSAQKFNRDLRERGKGSLRERFGVTLGFSGGNPHLKLALQF